ncbi:MAG TPA: YetF domain-containing protein [Flavisolibacter sp.]
MKKEDIKLGDIQRLLFGEAPPEFLIEVLIRTLVIFLALLIFLRIIGKRMGGVLTISELAVMLTLGAVLAVPMQMPDRGLLQGMLILVVILLLQRGLNLWEFKSSKVEQLTQGSMTMLVKDGVIKTGNMAKSRISKQQLFAKLRESNIHNLGKVKRAYLEACGVFSVYKYDDDKPGLSVLPSIDEGIYGFRQDRGSDQRSCTNCGYTAREERTRAACKLCGANTWIKSII